MTTDERDRGNMLLDHDVPPIPPRWDPVLGAGAVFGTAALLGFLLTQLDADYRVYGATRFAIILWCVELAMPCASCWLLRPRIIHLSYALRVGRALAVLPAAPDGADRPTLATSPRVWCTLGTLGTVTWTIAAGIDITAALGVLNLHGVNLSITAFILCQFAVVCSIPRVVGPALATVDGIYTLARTKGTGPRAKIYNLGERAHG